MEVSSSNFHGTGVTMRPAAAPAPALHISRSRRVTFICLPSLVRSLMATEASDLDAVPAVAVFAIAHLHAFVRCTAQARNRMPPDVAAVSADVIYLVNPHLVRLPVSRMTFRAGQTSAFHMDRVREPNIGWLSRVHQPRSLVSGLDVVLYESCLGLTLANPFGVASGAFLHRGNSGERSVFAKSVALTTIRDAGFFRVRLVTELEWLLFLHVECPRKPDPPRHQRDGKPKSEDQSIPRDPHSSTAHPRLEKKCWNRQTRCCRDSSCATPRTGEPPSQPGACVSWISSDSRFRSSACHAAACGPETSPARVRPGNSQPSKSQPAP